MQVRQWPVCGYLPCDQIGGERPNLDLCHGFVLFSSVAVKVSSAGRVSKKVLKPKTENTIGDDEEKKAGNFTASEKKRRRDLTQVFHV